MSFLADSFKKFMGKTCPEINLPTSPIATPSKIKFTSKFDVCTPEEIEAPPPLEQPIVSEVKPQIVKIPYAFGDVPEGRPQSSLLTEDIYSDKEYFSTYRILSIIPGRRLIEGTSLFKYTFKSDIPGFIEKLNQTLKLIGLRVNEEQVFVGEKTNVHTLRFVVDSTTISDSISNNYTTGKLAQMANFGSSIFGELNQILPPKIAKDKNHPLVGALLQSVSSVINSLKESDATLAKIIAGGRIDIPKVWESSSFESEYSFTIKLVSRPILEDFRQRVLLPLGILLTLACPQFSKDDNSVYFFPFVISAMLKGVAYIPLGAITSLTIDKVYENGFITNDGKLFGIKVDLKISPLYEILPVSDKLRTSAFGLTTASYLKNLEEAYLDQSILLDNIPAATNKDRMDPKPIEISPQGDCKVDTASIKNCAVKLIKDPVFLNAYNQMINSGKINPNVSSQMVAVTICAESGGNVKAVGDQGKAIGSAQIYSDYFRSPQFISKYPPLYEQVNMASGGKANIPQVCKDTVNNLLRSDPSFNYKMATAVLNEKYSTSKDKWKTLANYIGRIDAPCVKEKANARAEAANLIGEKIPLKG